MTTIISMDLSLNGSALAVLSVKDGVMTVVKTEFIDNTKYKRHGVKLSRIAGVFTAMCTFYQPDIIVREAGFTRFNKSTQALYKVIGVIDYLADQLGYKTVPAIAPTSVKKLITGDGKATKKEVADVIQLLTGFSGNYDETDAVAVGIAYYNKLREDSQ